MDQTLKQTPLFEAHKKLGARFTEFSGWEMPLQYQGLSLEHNAVRSAAGIFDVSHMGVFWVSGQESLSYLQYLTSNDLQKIKPGKAQYSLLLNKHAGVVDDIIIYQITSIEYLICVNAGNVESDFNWFTQNNSFDVVVENKSNDYGLIALQGPLSRKIFAKFLEISEEEINRTNFPSFTFNFFENNTRDITRMLVATTGYTGEDGFEIFCLRSDLTKLWHGLLEVGQVDGLVPAGFGSRDTLRLEACYPLHGHELKEDLNVLSCGVNWAIKPDKGEFIGRDSLLEYQKTGLEYLLVALKVIDKGIVRAEAELFSDNNEKIGWVSSGTKTPSLDYPCALAFVKSEFALVGQEFIAQVRDKQIKVVVVEKPFYKRRKLEL